MFNTFRRIIANNFGILYHKKKPKIIILTPEPPARDSFLVDGWSTFGVNSSEPAGNQVAIVRKVGASYAL